MFFNGAIFVAAQLWYFFDKCIEVLKTFRIVGVTTFILVNKYVTLTSKKKKSGKNGHFVAQRKIVYTLVLFFLRRLYG